MEELVLKVNGMMCEGCENRVQNAVSQIEGVKEAKADYKEGEVTIKVEDNSKIDEIKETIDDIGYEVVED